MIAAADRRVAGRRRCRQREQALGAEVLERSEAIDSVEAKVAAHRDEVGREAATSSATRS